MGWVRISRSPWLGWRFVAVPLVFWLLLTATGTAGLLRAQHNGREAVVQRFHLRVALMDDFVTSYVSDLMDRERAAARAFLTGPAVAQRDFTRAVIGLGYPGAVLLDADGRVLNIAPDRLALIGTDLTDRYAHLRTAVRDGRPAVSAVVPSAAREVPVVAFAVPFDTAAGRRVFSGAIDIRHNQLSTYVSTALTLRGVRVQLVDASGGIVAANRPLNGTTPKLSDDNPDLATALRHRPTGRYQQDGTTWRFVSEAVEGTPWRLSATVREDVLFASITGSQHAALAALGAAALAGLIVVAAIARNHHSRRDLQRSRADLAHRAEQLQQANTQMSDFMTMLTHDVRQPLTSVVATGELMLTDWADLDENTKRHDLDRMITAGHRAANLVEEILTLAQLDAGALVAHPLPFDVTRTVRDAVTAHNTTSTGAPATMRAPDECTALADPAHLPLILANLLGNTTKYGAPPVTVTVTDDPDHVRIHVADHGHGVPEAFRPHLFDRFSRATTGTTGKPGAGLGLYFVHQLAHANTVTVDYHPNQPHGAVFTLTLPHPPATHTGHHSAASAPLSPPGTSTPLPG